MCIFLVAQMTHLVMLDDQETILVDACMPSSLVPGSSIYIDGTCWDREFVLAWEKKNNG